MSRLDQEPRPGRSAPASWPAPDCRCADVVEEHLLWMRLRGRRPTSLYNRRRVLYRLRLALGACLLDADEPALRRWREGLDLRPASAAVEINNVKRFYLYATEEGHVPHDPARRLPTPSAPQGAPRPVSEDLLRRALSTAPTPKVRAVLALAGLCGLRAMEIAGLRWEHVLEDHDPPVLLVADGKGGRQRILPLPPAVLDAVRAAGGRDWIIERADGRPGGNQAWRISQLANDHLTTLGTHHRLHSFRHRYATALYRDTTDLRLVAGLMGHANPATTARYAAYAPDKAYAAALRIGQIA